MGGGKWKKEQILLQEIKRAKNKEKKDETRRRDEIGKNYGFCDDEKLSKCENCFTMTGDVYRYRVELPRLRNRITGFPVMSICPACVDDLSGKGARLVSIPELTVADLSPNRNQYDNKPRIKLF